MNKWLIILLVLAVLAVIAEALYTPPIACQTLIINEIETTICGAP